MTTTEIHHSVCRILFVLGEFLQFILKETHLNSTQLVFQTFDRTIENFEIAVCHVKCFRFETYQRL